MNFIFISPHYPDTYWQFCDRLARAGVSVLGIGDTPYFNLSAELKGALTEYYYLESLEDYDQVYRAVAFFAFKYGRIDWLESNNDYWLEQDARLRTDFHITTGAGAEEAAAWKDDSHFRQRCEAAGIPCAAEGVRDGERCSYNAIVDAQGEPLFEAMAVRPNLNAGYVCPELPAPLRRLGRAALKELGLRSRFFHMEFLRRGDGEYIALGMCPCPFDGRMPDLLNFAHSTDVYQIWADMVTHARRLLPESADRHWCAAARRLTQYGWRLSHEEVLMRWGGSLALCQPTGDGNGHSYLIHAQSEDEARAFIDDVQALEI